MGDWDFNSWVCNIVLHVVTKAGEIKLVHVQFDGRVFLADFFVLVFLNVHGKEKLSSFFCHVLFHRRIDSKNLLC